LTNALQHRLQSWLLRSVDLDPRSDLEPPKSSDGANAGQNLGVQSFMIQVPGMPFPANEWLSRQIRRALAMEVNNGTRKLRKQILGQSALAATGEARDHNKRFVHGRLTDSGSNFDHTPLCVRRREDFSIYTLPI
jgi:hypothetical protein